MYSASSELQTLRGRVFFWIGLLILPVFWVWWMLSKTFARGKRVVKFLALCDLYQPQPPASND